MILALSKWWQTVRIFWAKYTAYRINFLLTVIGPALVFFFIKYNLWHSIYQGGKSGLVIKGYNFEQMITYHVWAFVISLIGQGYMSMNLAEDIRLGRISTYLIYPFDFWEFHTAGWISYQLLQLVVAAIALGFIVATGITATPEPAALLAGVAYATLVGAFWFALQYFLGLIAFWLEETWILRVLFNILSAFLSGAFIPLELYPQALVDILHFTPFPWLQYYPIKVFMGQVPLQGHAVLILLGWMALFVLLNRLIWRRGIKLYTAAGM